MNYKHLVTLTLSFAAFAPSMASAEDIYITGSTAFRTQAHAAIIAAIPGVQYGFVNASSATINNTSQAIFKGTFNGTATTVYTSWSGSIAGVRDVLLNTDVARKVKFLPSSTTVSAGGTGTGTAGTDLQFAQIAFTDNEQVSTYYADSTLLTAEKVGVIPFKWFASNGSDANLTDMNPLRAQLLFGNGSAPLALFTGLSSDEGRRVFATGRDPESGTRVITFAESGIGIFNSSILQYNPTFGTGSPVPTTSVASIALSFPAIPAIPPAPAYPSAQSGHSSGSTLARSLRYSWPTSGMTPPNRNNGCFVSYLGGSDWGTALAAHNPPSTLGAGPARELTWNGTPYSFDNVANGKYTFWGYEYIMYHNDLAGDALLLAQTLTTNLSTLPATAAGSKASAVVLNLSDMRVLRNTDAGIISPGY